MHEARNGHRGMVLCFTGLSASGNTSIALGVERQLIDQDYRTVVDGNNLNSGLNLDLGFCDNDRHKNLHRLAHLSRLYLEQGYLVLFSFISTLEVCRHMVYWVKHEVPITDQN